jgi:hypothetical protein
MTNRTAALGWWWEGPGRLDRVAVVVGGWRIKHVCSPYPAGRSLRWGSVPGGYGAASTLAALIPLAFP